MGFILDAPSSENEVKTTVMHNMFQDPNHRPHHEHVFINIYLERKKLHKKSIAREFVAFQREFFPDYNWWILSFYDLETSVLQKAQYCQMIFERGEKYGLATKEEWCDAMNFGEIMTEYMIRRRGYTLITNDSRKTIVTAEQNCDKLYAKYIEEGYHIIRLAKVVPKKVDIVDLFGHWQTLPVFPTNCDNLSCQVSEFIEDKNKQLQKVNKY